MRGSRIRSRALSDLPHHAEVETSLEDEQFNGRDPWRAIGSDGPYETQAPVLEPFPAQVGEFRRLAGKLIPRHPACCHFRALRLELGTGDPSTVGKPGRPNGEVERDRLDHAFRGVADDAYAKVRVQSLNESNL